MDGQDPNRTIQLDVDVEGDIDQVWDTWTTEEGIKSFFAPDCHVDLKVGGAYEILFDPDAEPGQRGAEGVRILAIQPKKMLAFTWNAPPRMSLVRQQWTHVVVRFQDLEYGRTRVTLFHDGWGQGGEWDQAYEYFTKAWRDIVLPRLQYRFSVGPVDWQNQPKRG